ncbi:MAG: glycosyltransferase family 4 protein [Cytophagaceae bacterium]|nr:glycosyltransferase family 4 protein [Cytophagaceae bacterium]
MKSKVIFIGSFRKSAKDGSVGGQMFACSSLINSPLRNDIDFVLIDSTADSVPAPPLYRRFIKAVNRIGILFHRLLDRKVTSVLIFSSAGFSLIEKGLMVLICKIFGKKVLFAPRSGLIKDDYDKSVFFRWFIPMVIKRSDFVICQGIAWKEYYQEISRETDRKFLVIPNWIDIVPYLNNNPEYKLRESATVLYMGWLEGYKGIFDFIEAIKLLKDEGVAFKAKICGMGSAKGKMLNTIKQFGLESVIEYVGWVTGDDKMKQFRETDIFVLPSHREGMPNVLMEAMSSGIPVVATKVGGVPELVQNGINGFLVDSGSPIQLADCISQLINSKELRTKFSDNGRKYIIDHHSVEGIADIFKKELA